MEVHKSNFEDADFDLSIFGNFHLKHMYFFKNDYFLFVCRNDFALYTST